MNISMRTTVHDLVRALRWQRSDLLDAVMVRIVEAGAIFDRLGVDRASVTPLWQVFGNVRSLSGG